MANQVTVGIEFENDETKHDFSFLPSDTILQVKQRVGSILRWEVEEQSLFYDDLELKNDRSLESYNFKEGGHFHLKLLRTNTYRDLKFYVLVKSDYKENFMGVKATDTVADLKNKIERNWGIFSSRFVISHNNEIMKNDLTLSQYNVCANSVIKVDIEKELR
ncbi:hypothetical protein JCGZ_23028 [Jatropha curcas]|uniref:Ubiquitin-like domain-containing protein n=1 Tax=Jatropha curcas TaxID=180498 RepID=A0A067LGY4_JATCU|nr:uncharacterized protein LOC105628507 [Jatropha curcas]KDP43820.1 hypothetical protein JCGZ_23028 [Jatropha curcas]